MLLDFFLYQLQYQKVFRYNALYVKKGFHMQTLTVKVEDNFIQDFLTIIGHYKDKIHLEEDKNLKYDPYFYERQKDLQQTMDDIDNGTMSTHDFESSIDNLIVELEN